MIEFNSRVDKIAKDLQEQIAQGKLKPGERLASERSLCSLFGVGRIQSDVGVGDLRDDHEARCRLGVFRLA